jgi:hypothetical protein
MWDGRDLEKRRAFGLVDWSMTGIPPVIRVERLTGSVAASITHESRNTREVEVACRPVCESPRTLFTNRRLDSFRPVDGLAS